MKTLWRMPAFQVAWLPLYACLATGCSRTVGYLDMADYRLHSFPRSAREGGPESVLSGDLGTGRFWTVAYVAPGNRRRGVPFRYRVNECAPDGTVLRSTDFSHPGPAIYNLRGSAARMVSSDGKLFAFCDGRAIFIVDTGDGTKRELVTGVAGPKGTSFELWGFCTNTCLLVLRKDENTSEVCGPGPVEKRTARLQRYDLASGGVETIWEGGVSPFVTGSVLSRDRRMVAFAEKKRRDIAPRHLSVCLTLLDLGTEEVLLQTPPKECVGPYCFSNDGKSVYYRGSIEEPGFRCRQDIYCVSIATGEERTVVRLPRDFLVSWMAPVGPDRLVILWRTNDTYDPFVNVYQLPDGALLQTVSKGVHHIMQLMGPPSDHNRVLADIW